MSVDVARLTLEIDSRQLQNAGTQLDWFTKKGEKAERQMVRLRTSSRALGGSILASREQFQQFGTTAQRVGRNLSLYLGAPLLAIGAKVTMVGKTFETEMTKINTLVGIAEGELSGMEERILSVSRSTGRGATELARALFTVTSAGARGATALDILETSAKASAIGLGETQTIAQATTAVLQAYGEENLSAARAIDILASTVRAGNLEASSLAPTLGRVVGLAAQLGVSFEELGANIATFTRLGVNAEEAVTALRGLLNSLISPSSEGAKVLEELGLSFGYLRERVRDQGLADTMIFLLQNLEGQDEALAKVVPNVRALSNVLGTAGVQAESYAEILTDVEEGHGIVNEGFETVGKTAEQQWNQAKAALEAASISLRDSTLPVMVELATVIEEVAGWFSTLDEETQSNIVRFGLFAIAAGPVVMVFGKLVSVIPRVIGMLKTLRIALATNPWTLAIGVVGGLATLLAGKYYSSTRDAVEVTNEFSEAVMDQNKTLAEAQKALEGLTLQKMMDNTVEAIKLTRQEMEGLRSTLQGYFENVQASGRFRDSTFQEWLEAIDAQGGSGQHSMFLGLQEQLNALEEQKETIIELNRLENELAQARVNTGTVAKQRIPILEDEIDNLRMMIGLATKYREEHEAASDAANSGNKTLTDRIQIEEDLFDTVDQAEKVIRPLQLMEEYLLGFPVSINEAELAMEKLQQRMSEATGQDQRDELRAYIEELEKIIDAMKGIEEESDDVKTTTDKLNQTAKDLGFTFSSAAEQAIVAWEGFASFLNGLFQDILRITTRSIITEPLSSGLTSLFSGMGIGSEETVEDALVTSSGKVIHIDPNDNALFMKDFGPLNKAMKGAGGGNVYVSVENYTDSKVDIQRTKEPGGDIRIRAIVKREVSSLIEEGELDGVARRNWNVSRNAMRRG